ncbi:hypothetical protein Val02_78310 [Virgisporangium aliadipatigenens]|uniref:Secreted protein n=1 Tax=Virgisporangium aliadipatigenens TaxID=741659 RepID=A0A8J3YW84_9ACTN|nr:hypothetical protein [Virgisporangium aliadipatigenens]GIJ50945.1 hypothetical protein Val02_78310 [Virgisporangium aliadipatigenens]
MQTVLQQLPALLGVVIGSVATFLVAQTTERTKWRRTLHARWDERRLDAYAEYAFAVKSYVTLLRRVAGGMGLDSIAHPLSHTDGLPRVEQAEDERAAKFENVLLLGDQETIDAARAWHRAAWELADLVQGRSTGGAPAWRPALNEVWQARTLFYKAARVSLDVRSGPEALHHLQPRDHRR